MEQRKQQTQAMEAILAAMQATTAAWEECNKVQRCPGARLAMSEAYDALVRAGRAIGHAKESGRGQAEGASVTKLHREEQITIHDGE